MPYHAGLNFTIKALELALLTETPFHEFDGFFAAVPAISTFCYPALPAALGFKSAFLPKNPFHEISGKNAGNAISRFWQDRQPIDFYGN